MTSSSTPAPQIPTRQPTAPGRLSMPQWLAESGLAHQNTQERFPITLPVGTAITVDPHPPLVTTFDARRCLSAPRQAHTTGTWSLPVGHFNESRPAGQAECWGTCGPTALQPIVGVPMNT